MSQPADDNLPEGKLAIEILGPILNLMPTNGLPVANRIGMDAGILGINSEKVFSYSKIAIGFDLEIGAQLVSDLVNDTASLGKPAIINPVVLFPVGTTGETIKRVLIEISEAAERNGIIVGKGHTEITRTVKQMILIATVLGPV